MPLEVFLLLRILLAILGYNDIFLDVTKQFLLVLATYSTERHHPLAGDVIVLRGE